ncbi:hypothetical protein VTI74DRAFT_6371 [Chaetomium olivicolor]
MIWAFTYAIFFLAVPHKGSDHTSWGQIIARIYSTVTIQPSNSFLETLRRTSGDSEELNARFKPLHRAYKFYSWVESLPCQALGVIVSKESATLGLSATREKVRIANRDHRGICKFSAADDPEWMELSAYIVEAAKNAATTCYLTPTMHYRQAMFEGPELHNTVDEVPSLRKANYEAQRILDQGDDLFAKEEALEGARKAEDAESRIMEGEAWAIARLNEHQREVLRTSYVLQRAVSAHCHRKPDETRNSELNNARRLQSELAKRTKLNMADIHASHQRYNRAEAEKKGIEGARAKVANKDDTEFWIATAGIVNEARDEAGATQQEAPEDDGMMSSLE